MKHTVPHRTISIQTANFLENLFTRSEFFLSLFEDYCHDLLVYAHDAQEARVWLSYLLHFIPPSHNYEGILYPELFEYIDTPKDPSHDTRPRVVLQCLLRMICPSSIHYDTTHLLISLRSTSFSAEDEQRGWAHSDLQQQARIVRIMALDALNQFRQSPALEQLSYLPNTPARERIRESIQQILGITLIPKNSLDLDLIDYTERLSSATDVHFHRAQLDSHIAPWLQAARDFFGSSEDPKEAEAAEAVWHYFCLMMLVEPQLFLDACQKEKPESQKALAPLMRLAYCAITRASRTHPWIEDMPVIRFCRETQPSANPHLLSDELHQKLHQAFLSVFLPYLYRQHRTLRSSCRSTHLPLFMHVLKKIKGSQGPRMDVDLSVARRKKYIEFIQKRDRHEPPHSTIADLYAWAHHTLSDWFASWSTPSISIEDLRHVQSARLSLPYTADEAENLKRHGLIDDQEMHDLFSQPQALSVRRDHLV